MSLLEVRKSTEIQSELFRMDEINVRMSITVNNFHYICRTCLCNLKETVAFSVKDKVTLQNETTAQCTEPLMISEVLYKCTSVMVSDNNP